MKNLLYNIIKKLRTMADEKENTTPDEMGKKIAPLESNVPNNEITHEHTPAENTPEFPTIEKEIVLETPDQILNRINNEIKMKEETETPTAKPTKKKEVPEKDGGKPDNTLIIIGIAAVLIAVGLFLWLNYQKKMKALDESNANPDNQKQPVANGYDEREYYNN